MSGNKYERKEYDGAHAAGLRLQDEGGVGAVGGHGRSMLYRSNGCCQAIFAVGFEAWDRAGTQGKK